MACATKKVERGYLVSENLGGWMNEIKQDNIAETAIKSFEINTGSAEPSAAASADVASADAASADVASADVTTRDSMWSSDASCIPSLQLMMCHVCDRHQLSRRRRRRRRSHVCESKMKPE